MNGDGYVLIIRCYCAIAEEVDQYDLLGLMKQCYPIMYTLASSPPSMLAQPSLAQRVAKFMRIAIGKLGKCRLDSGLSRVDIASSNAMITSWTAIALSWVESCHTVELIQLHLAMMMELFKFLEISLEAFPENTSNCNLNAVLASLNVLVLIKNYDRSNHRGPSLLFGTDLVGNCGYTSDGDRIDFELLVIQIFEILSSGLFYVSGQQSTALLVENIEQITHIMFHFMQLNNQELEDWDSDPNRFVNADQVDTRYFSIRRSGSQLVRRVCKIAKEHAFVTFLRISKDGILGFFDRFIGIDKDRDGDRDRIFVGNGNIEGEDTTSVQRLEGPSNQLQQPSCRRLERRPSLSNMSMQDVVWLEGILWTLMAVCRRYMKVWAMERRSNDGDQTAPTPTAPVSFTGSPCSPGCPVASVDADSSVGISSKPHPIFAAVPPQSLASYILYVCKVLLWHEHIPALLKGRALSLYCLVVHIHDSAESVQVLIKAVELMKEEKDKDAPFALRLQACRAVFQMINKLSRCYCNLEVHMNALDSMLPATRHSDTTLSAIIVTQAVECTLQLSNDTDDTTVHILIELAVEALKNFVNSLSRRCVALIVKLGCVIWRQYCKNALILDLTLDIFMRVLVLPDHQGYQPMLEQGLPVFRAMLFDNMSTSSPSSSSCYEGILRILAKIGSVGASSSAVPAVAVAKAQSIELLVHCSNSPELSAFLKEIMSALVIVLSGCCKHGEAVHALVGEALYAQLGQSIARAVQRAFSAVERQGDAAAEIVAPAVGLMCHAALYLGSAVGEQCVVELLSQAACLIRNHASSRHVKYCTMMGFVHLFARNTEEMVRLIVIVQLNPVLHGSLLKLVRLWLQLHLQLGSRYNCIISSLGLIKLIEVLQESSANHLLAAQVMERLLLKLPDVLFDFDQDGSLRGDDLEDDADVETQTKYELSYEEEGTDTGFDSDFADEWSNADVEGDDSSSQRDFDGSIADNVDNVDHAGEVDEEGNMDSVNAEDVDPCDGDAPSTIGTTERMGPTSAFPGGATGSFSCTDSIPTGDAGVSMSSYDDEGYSGYAPYPSYSSYPSAAPQGASVPSYPSYARANASTGTGEFNLRSFLVSQNDAAHCLRATNNHGDENGANNGSASYITNTWSDNDSGGGGSCGSSSTHALRGSLFVGFGGPGSDQSVASTAESTDSTTVTLVNISDRLVFAPPSADPLSGVDLEAEVVQLLRKLQHPGSLEVFIIGVVC